MAVMPGPDLRAGRQVVSARRPAGLQRNPRDRETPARGQANLFRHLSITVGFPPQGGRRWVNVHMLLTRINRE